MDQGGVTPSLRPGPGGDSARKGKTNPDDHLRTVRPPKPQSSHRYRFCPTTPPPPNHQIPRHCGDLTTRGRKRRWSAIAPPRDDGPRSRSWRKGNGGTRTTGYPTIKRYDRAVRGIWKYAGVKVFSRIEKTRRECKE